MNVYQRTFSIIILGMAISFLGFITTRNIYNLYHKEKPAPVLNTPEYSWNIIQINPDIPIEDTINYDQLQKDLTSWYEIYNNTYFDGQLPRDTILGCTPYLSTQLDAQGVTAITADRKFIILIDSRFCIGNRVEKRILLHEMVHVKLFPVSGHPETFTTEIHRLLLTGAFDDVL